MKNNLQGDNKAQSWLDGILKLPFGVYKTNKVMEFKNEFIKGITDEIRNSLHYTIRDKLDNAKQLIESDVKNISKLVSSDIPYEKRISLLKVSDDIKNKAYEKLKSIKSNMQGDSKAQAWLDGFLKIPFGQYSENEMISFKNNFINKLNNGLTTEFEITNYINELEKEEPENDLILEWNKYLIDRVDYLKDVRTKLDKAVYGHKEAKTQLERIFAQWINGSTKGAILGIQGPPGNGKTTLAKYGLSQCLVDKKGNPRPFQFLAIGGSVNGSTLVGHNYTYVGSTWGKIVDMLVTSKCMNPIIFIDEIDKVSTTEHGREIISILTHLTDLTQNDEFEDKYFTGVKLDLSKALIVFFF
jgi:ATP-dependent Lon protease